MTKTTTALDEGRAALKKDEQARWDAANRFQGLFPPPVAEVKPAASKRDCLAEYWAETPNINSREQARALWLSII